MEISWHWQNFQIMHVYKSHASDVIESITGPSCDGDSLALDAGVGSHQRHGEGSSAGCQLAGSCS